MFGGNDEQLRQEKFKALCFSQDYQFLDNDEFGIKSLLKYFSIFDSRNGKIRNLCQKKIGILHSEINLFDYKYKVSTGKSTVTYDQTVFFINSKDLGLPEFNMKPEHFGHKLMAYLGWDDIDFEEYPSFSEKYFLKGEDEDFIRHHFNDKVLKFFSKTNGWTLEASNYFLIFYSDDTLVPQSELESFLKVGIGVSDLFKSENAD